MDIFGILTMAGGLALFLYGMSTMGDGLVQMAGGKLEKILEKLTNRLIKGVLLGALVTAVIQSSSATTVMVVGFVNSGIMNLRQAVGVIMGANVGTTVTSWILSLVGIQGDNVFLRLLEPSSFSPVLAVIGIVMLMSGKEGSKKKNTGSILLGFAVLMFGMQTMSGAVAPLADNESFTGMLTAFSNPILGMAAGALLTAVIQSSSASVGILQALCTTGAVTYGAAIPIIMGQNIGTCVTALISSVGASRNARRASLIHLYFNLIGTIVFVTAFYLVNSLADLDFMNETAGAASIAVIHSLFNIGCVVLLLPFSKGLVKLAEITVPEKKGEDAEGKKIPEQIAALDERFLDRPAVAMQLCRNAANEMCRLSCLAFEKASNVLVRYDEKEMQEVIELENQTDMYEDALGGYLVRLSGRELSSEDSRQLSIMLNSMGDFERIADHFINLVESAREMNDKGLSLTHQGDIELDAYGMAVKDIVKITETVFLDDDLELAREVEPMEEVIDVLSDEMKQRHIVRLRRNMCSMEAGLILEDIITNYERISDHCSNIALALIEISEDGFGTHAYTRSVSKSDDPSFRESFERLSKRYVLPAVEE